MATHYSANQSGRHPRREETKTSLLDERGQTLLSASQIAGSFDQQHSYENAFAANRLQNYELPSGYKEHPSARTGATKVIGNDRGHLLPGVPRSKESPWGKFKGTWDDSMDCRKTKHCDNLVISKSKQASALKSFENRKEKAKSIQGSAKREQNGNQSVLQHEEPAGNIEPVVETS